MKFIIIQDSILGLLNYMAQVLLLKKLPQYIQYLSFLGISYLQQVTCDQLACNKLPVMYFLKTNSHLVQLRL